jgi:hypothetical protein
VVGPALRRFGRLQARRPSVPSERDWDRSVLLEPRSARRHPELISDGGGLPFAPAALSVSGGQLDPTDAAVGALIAQITRRSASKGAIRALDKRGAAPPPVLPRLDGWRLLARDDGEVLFGRGQPPELVTVAVRQDGRRGAWTCVGVSKAKPLRATRDGIRASGWRLDPTREADPEQTVLRVLVTEQTWAGGKRADSRLLAPDLHVGTEDLVLTMFVTPRPGFQVRSPNPETPARIALPHPMGSRGLIDGALYNSAAPGTLATGEADRQRLIGTDAG